jgi:hypothetical protein
MADVSNVYVDVMNDFKEPIPLENRENAPVVTTEFLKLQLSTSEVYRNEFMYMNIIIHVCLFMLRYTFMCILYFLAYMCICIY